AVAVDDRGPLPRHSPVEGADAVDQDLPLLDCRHPESICPANRVTSVEWKRPTKRRVRAIRERLRELYGKPVNHPHGHPIAELIRKVLSQHTNDRNRDRAYAALRERFPTWEAVRDAPVAEVEEAIRPGGLGKQKAPRLQ